ncbi:MAG: hypothetical protein A3B68_08015 [Candidatus Melainabacteria bacterium RIFCSPHIGHO2_02_FULL_34_12]|nr:MAG: hypothetical protein A3B68_08015 [Candidatus Melainabacteria bacterium RIFCSPHIGHO2_02_FULL_34_12]
MQDAAKECLSFIRGKTRKDFNTNKVLVYALVKVIEIIGEAASKISKDFKNKHTEIPWQDIVGMRNHLIHVYFDIDLDILWDTVNKDISKLIKMLQKLNKK